MSQVTITFTTDNAAFEDNGFNKEIAHILDTAKEILENEAANGSLNVEHKLRDTNGNAIGKVTYSVI